MYEVLIGYVNDFTFHNKKAKEALEPHPIKGGIYRILKSPVYWKEEGDPVVEAVEKFLYQLYVGKKNNKAKLDTIALGDTLSGDYDQKWSFSIDVLTKENYLDYDYNEGDLERLQKWLDTDNEDIKKLLKKAPIPVNVTEEEMIARPQQDPNVQRALDKVGEKMMEFDKVMSRLSEGLNYLVAADQDVLPPLSSVIVRMASAGEWFRGKPDIARAMLMSSTSHEVAPMWAVANIQNYLLNDGKDPEYLEMAVINLLYELQRFNKHQKNDTRKD